MDISLIIPSFNEKENIAALLAQASRALQEFSYELIVVDDDSPDGTADIVAGLAQHDSRVHLIKRTNDRGLSSAVVAGFSQAQAPILAVMDADFSHDAQLLPVFIREIQAGVQIVVGSRRVEGGGADHWPWFRRLYSDLATILAVGLFRLPIKDPMSGFFALRREVFEKVQRSLNPTGYKILLEILLRSQVDQVKEIPFIFKDRKQGYSKLTGTVAFQYMMMFFQLWKYLAIFQIRKKSGAK